MNLERPQGSDNMQRQFAGFNIDHRKVHIGFKPELDALNIEGDKTKKRGFHYGAQLTRMTVGKVREEQ